ncbi:MAG: DUF3084 domain-containing protein [Candidatus Atribacteria bacterium]|nr:DUF3084 domain-containing protein [Candidatus Atribacteria bacterium]MCD6350306.1 DUF3084 domain-containing protein [Candidatus Atribacteria bacterium]
MKGSFSSFLLILSIILLSGIIAYVGDFLGRRIGRRKLSLFKLRPRYTAFLVSIVTGILIATVTLLVLSTASEDVRTALFGMQELRERLDSLNQEVIARSLELENTKKQLEDYQSKIQESEARERELQNTKIALEEQARLLEETVTQLEQQRDDLQQELASLQAELARLRSSIVAIRQGRIVFQDGEEILRAILPGGVSEKKAQEALLAVIRKGDQLALQKGAGRHSETGQAVFVPEEDFHQAVDKIHNASNDVVVRLVAAINSLQGEPVIARMYVDENRKIFSQGDIVYQTELVIDDETSVDVLLGKVLRELNAVGLKKGILPQGGKVGVISASNLTEVFRELENVRGEITLRAVAEEDVFTAGPLRVRLEVLKEQAPERQGTQSEQGG